jgi:hypothetical protein
MENLTFEIPAMLVKQREEFSQAIYVGVVKAKDFVSRPTEKFVIDYYRRTKNGDEGYQRTLNDSGVESIKNFILKETKNPLLPGALLFNSREPIDFEKISGNFGNLKIKAFRVDSIEDISKDGMLIIKLEADEFDNRDDLITRVAYNESNIVSNLIESTIDNSYYIVSPEDISIRSKETIDINIAHYDNANNIITTDFTYTIIDINAIDYDLIEIDETNIQIKNNKYPNNGTLNITNEDNGETIAIELKFIGLW